MFGKKTEGELSTVETIVGAETVFQGTIRTKNSLRVDGKLEGGVAEADGIVIGEKGVIQGDISGRIVVVGGKVTGNITASHSLEILSQAQVYGDINTASLSIGDGATFEGNCVMATEKSKIIEMEVEAKESPRRR